MVYSMFCTFGDEMGTNPHTTKQAILNHVCIEQAANLLVAVMDCRCDLRGEPCPRCRITRDLLSLRMHDRRVHLENVECGQ